MQVWALLAPGDARSVPQFAAVDRSLGDHAVVARFNEVGRVALGDGGGLTFESRNADAHTVDRGEITAATAVAGSLYCVVRTVGIRQADQPEQATQWGKDSDGTMHLAFDEVDRVRVDDDDQVTVTFVDGDETTVDGLARITRAVEAAPR